MNSMVQPYGILQALAVVVGILLIDRELRKQNDGLLDRPGLLLVALISSGICGRLHVLAESLFIYGESWNEIAPKLHPLTGGSSFYGAIGGIVLIILIWPRRLPGGSRAALFDATVIGLGVGIFIGRLACLSQGCCHGYPLDPGNYWSTFVGNLLPHWQGLWQYQPLPLWLGLWALVSTWVAYVTKKHLLAGNEFLVFAGLFSMGRFPLEFMRWQPVGSPAISMAQWEALALVALTLGFVLIRERSSRSILQES
jgi:phosphatidylglycerol---prolipoprotein diacylglyceryl transferase